MKEQRAWNMLVETKIRQTAVMAAVDIKLMKMKKSPGRCTRNLLELGLFTYPNKISKKEQQIFQEQLKELCQIGDVQGARTLFINTFIQEPGQ